MDDAKKNANRQNVEISEYRTVPEDATGRSEAGTDEGKGSFAGEGRETPTSRVPLCTLCASPITERPDHLGLAVHLGRGQALWCEGREELFRSVMAAVGMVFEPRGGWVPCTT